MSQIDTAILESASSERNDASTLVWRAAELVLLFVAPPLIWAVNIWRPPVVPALGVLAMYVLVVLLRDPTFDRRNLWRGDELKTEWRTILVLFVTGVAMCSALMWSILPEKLFHLLRTDPRLWAMIMIGYPVFSVYPQELLYRAFFFHRYQPLFPRRWVMILFSALLFAWAHVLFRHWMPVVVTLVGGLIFAWRYDRTRSMAAISIEHALYGQLIFTIGLGAYFYHGTIKAMEQLAR